jgi:hypothetical protein
MTLGMRTYTTAAVASQASWRMPMRLPEGFQDSHQDGGPLFLIFVADPRTVRLCTTHLAEERILIRRDLHRVLVTEARRAAGHHPDATRSNMRRQLRAAHSEHAEAPSGPAPWCRGIDPQVRR